MEMERPERGHPLSNTVSCNTVLLKKRVTGIRDEKLPWNGKTRLPFAFNCAISRIFGMDNTVFSHFVAVGTNSI